jgi:penicillin-binding protein 1A
MQETTKIYDRNGILIDELYLKKRTVVPLASLPKELRDAILAIEDRNFYHHSGYEFRAIMRAFMANLRAGEVKQGGSTITQQLARNAFLSSRRTYKRKIQELWLARKIENTYTKSQILECYANRVYLGSGYYGVEAAAQGYFGKPATSLNLEESALVAGLAKAPNVYSPHRNSAAALERRKQVLDAMVECGFTSRENAARAAKQPLGVRPRSNDLENANYATEYIKEQLLEKFGYEKTFGGGLRVYSTIDQKMQAAAEASVESQLVKLEQQRELARLSRAKYLKEYLVLAAVDGEEARPDYLQGALLSMSAKTGEIYALVGGRSYKESKFNRAIYATRQPGSAFKPFVYATALELGMSPSSQIQANATEFKTPQGLYRPSNSDGASYESVSLRAALRKSINTAAIELGQEIGVPNIIRRAHRFGIEGNLPDVISLPLGAGEVTLLEMVRAYSAFPNQGMITDPTIILRVEDHQGKLLYSNTKHTRRAIDEQTAFLMTTMLADVVDRGTGTGIRAAGFRGPAGGKTGTTNDFHDAWFLGFTPEVVTGVWVGFDSPREIMRRGYGSSLAVPIWAGFMKQAFPKTSEGFRMPPGITRALVCTETGKLATYSCNRQILGPDGSLEDDPSSTYMDYFLENHVPQPCSDHSSQEPEPGQSILGTAVIHKSVVPAIFKNP